MFHRVRNHERRLADDLVHVVLGYQEVQTYRQYMTMCGGYTKARTPDHEPVMGTVVTCLRCCRSTLLRNHVPNVRTS